MLVSKSRINEASRQGKDGQTSEFISQTLTLHSLFQCQSMVGHAVSEFLVDGYDFMFQFSSVACLHIVVAIVVGSLGLMDWSMG